jgi:hypothetical protein
MGRVKDKIVTLQEQIDFITKLIRAVMDDKTSRFYGAFTDENVDTMHGILANLQTTQAWVNLPEFHQAAMHILDKAFLVKDSHGVPDTNVNQSIRGLRSYINAVDTSHENDCSDDLELIAALALISVARCIVPNRQTPNPEKEVRNG